MLRDGEVKWIPVSAARKMLGVSRQRVYQLIEHGVLLSMKVDNTILVSHKSVVSRQLVVPGVG